ncbi:hypothetical protein [Microcystis aeruginosa]|nr:hypothetical protein [Microcystis aeruginosa]
MANVNHFGVSQNENFVPHHYKKIPKQWRSKPFNSEDNPKIQPEKEPER